MNRRSFLKSGVLWVPPLFAIGRARGQSLTLADPAMVGRTRPSGQSTNELLTNLVAYWKLDETSDGSVAVTREDSHAANDLTDNNTTPSGSGKINNGCNFERDNSESLSSSDNAALSVGSGVSFTWSMWVNLESKPASSYCMFINKMGLTSSTNEYTFYYRQSVDRIRMEVGRSGSTTTDVVSADNLGSPSLSTWYNVVGWYDASADELGIAVNAGTANTVAKTDDPPDGSSTFYVGRSGAGLYMDGLIDEIGFWKRVLTADERTALYNGGSGLSYDSFA